MKKQTILTLITLVLFAFFLVTCSTDKGSISKKGFTQVLPEQTLFYISIPSIKKLADKTDYIQIRNDMMKENPDLVKEVEKIYLKTSAN